MLAVTVIAVRWQMKSDDHFVGSVDRICSDDDNFEPKSDNGG